MPFMGIEDLIPPRPRTYPRLENTYRLESKRPFLNEPVEKIIKSVIDAKFDRQSRYNPSEAPQMMIDLSTEIRTKVKALNFDRYRLICLVTICENNGQSGLGLMKCLWDPERDTYAWYKFENEYLLIYGVVIGIYYE